MGWLPKSRKAKRRLVIVLMAGAVLSAATILVFVALGDSVSMFYTPSQAAEANVPAERGIQLGGLVEAGSVMRHPDGRVEFIVTDNIETAKVVYKGDLPDLFREGQGVVVKGAFLQDGDFNATQVLARHDENYMPRELAEALKNTGEWRGEGAGPPAYETQDSGAGMRTQ